MKTVSKSRNKLTFGNKYFYLDVSLNCGVRFSHNMIKSFHFPLLFNWCSSLALLFSSFLKKTAHSISDAIKLLKLCSGDSTCVMEHHTSTFCLTCIMFTFIRFEWQVCALTFVSTLYKYQTKKNCLHRPLINLPSIKNGIIYSAIKVLNK